MILIKVKRNKIFTKDSLERCAKSVMARDKCKKEDCKGPAMGNGMCRWHGGVNTPQQEAEKQMKKKKRNNNCNRYRAQLKKQDKKTFGQRMQELKEFREKMVDE